MSWALSFLHLASIAADNISTCQRVSLLVKLYSLFSERVMFLKRNPKRVLSCFVTMLEFIISTHYLAFGKVFGKDAFMFRINNFILFKYSFDNYLRIANSQFLRVM